MFHVKPFPKDLPITIATYRETNQNLPPELMKVQYSSTVGRMDVIILWIQVNIRFLNID